MSKIMIDERDTRGISWKALGLFIFLKGNTKADKNGNILHYTNISKQTGIAYRTLKAMTDELEQKEYIKLVKRGIPARVYISFLK